MKISIEVEKKIKIYNENERLNEVLKDMYNSFINVIILKNSLNEFSGFIDNDLLKNYFIENENLEIPLKSIIQNQNFYVFNDQIDENKLVNFMINKKINYLPVLNSDNEFIKLLHLSFNELIDYKKKEEIKINYSKDEKKILIIGGAGYIGSHLCQLLVDNYKLRILDNLTFGIEPIRNLIEKENFELIQGDFLHIPTLIRSFNNIDKIIHLASIVGDPACKIDPDLTVKINIQGVKVLGILAKYFGIQKLIFASTCSVYGFYTDAILTEKSGLNPVSLYAESKVEAEKILLKLADMNFHPIILRFGTVFGLSSRMRFDLAINLLSALAIVEKRITLFDGEQWRPFIHVKDIGKCIKIVLETDKFEEFSGEIFNVGSNHLNCQIKDLGIYFREVFKDSIEIFHNNDKEDNRSYRVNFDKISTVFHFKPDFDILDAINEIRKFFENNQIDFREKKYSNSKIFDYKVITL
ncbi:NAD-dependent epimerase/dehydratase family protein [Candidatus Harpocratesius sp.]